MEYMEIEGKQHQLQEMFSQFIFQIPDYQRPYSWTKDHVDELFDDLTDTLDEAKENNIESPHYFLGSIVVIKRPDGDNKKADVVDGQQRLTTLTLLLCVLREFIDDSNLKQKIEKCIYYNKTHRLIVRYDDRDFFRSDIQSQLNYESFSTMDYLSEAPDNDSVQNMIRNTQFFITEIKKMKEDSSKKLAKLAELVVENTYLVVVSSNDLSSAYRIFSMN